MSLNDSSHWLPVKRFVLHFHTIKQLDPGTTSARQSPLACAQGAQDSCRAFLCLFSRRARQSQSSNRASMDGL